MSEAILNVNHLRKSFGNNEILKDIDFSVKPKDVTCIIGPSDPVIHTPSVYEPAGDPVLREILYHGRILRRKASTCRSTVPEWGTLR